MASLSLGCRAGTPRACVSQKRKSICLRRATRLICCAVDKDQVLSDIRSIITEQLGTDLDKVTPDAKFADLGADSLDTVEILMALEEKFDTQIDEEEAQKIATVQEAADVIAAQMK